MLIGAPIGWALVRRSHDRIRRAERQLHEAERLAQLGAMTGGLAHEIKNPLSTIGLNAQLIAEGVEELPVDEADRHRLTRRIDALGREADRLRDILEDFLRLAGALHLEMSRVNLNDLAEELVDFYAPQASSQGVIFRWEASERPVVAMADAKYLKQALLNLMLNAVQVMSKRDEGACDVRSELILRAESRVEAGERVVAMHVIDTGPGIDEEKRKRIFDPYFSTRSGGAGLGLAITQRIIAEHQGRIDVHSEVGKGSDFVVTLPAASEELKV